MNLNFKFTEILEHWAMQTVYISPKKYISKRYILRSTVWNETACCSDISRITNKVTLKSVEPVLYTIQISLLHIAYFP